MLDRILTNEDPEISAMIVESLTHDGVQILTNHTASGVLACFSLAGSPTFLLGGRVSQLRFAEGAYRPMRNAYEGVPTEVVLVGPAEAYTHAGAPRLTSRAAVGSAPSARPRSRRRR